MEFAPAAVLRQAEKDDAALRQWNEQRNGAAAPVTQVEEPPAGDTPTPQTAVAAPVEPAAQPAPQPESPAPRVDWKQKYLVLKGKYDAEVPRYAHENRQLKAELDGANARLLSLTEVNARLQAGHPNPQAEPEFDPALTNLIDRTTAAKVDAATKPLRDQLAENEKDAAARRFDQFKNDVNDFVHDATGTDWSELEAHQDWQAYMRAVVPEAGEIRGILLNQAMQRGDAVRVAHFYTDFFNRTRTSPAPAPAPAPAPSAPAVDPRAHLVTPATTASASTPAVPQRRTYTQAEVTRHYSEYGRAQLAGNASLAERERLEIQDKDISQAAIEGRIRP
jgi:hypothetical protein